MIPLEAALTLASSYSSSFNRKQTFFISSPREPAAGTGKNLVFGQSDRKLHAISS
ncbi:hypothetical protein AHM17_004324 [Salmonella enterica subsp. enterica serovar Sandiego]|nr:hypothetical protein [Salmonella enterica subsp. enterica serovar Sandiego]